MKCSECKHPMSEHGDGGCTHETRDDLCFCCLGEAEVALALLPKLERKIARLEKLLELATNERVRLYVNGEVVDLEVVNKYEVGDVLYVEVQT